MASREDFVWFKETFHKDIEAAIAGTPFTLDLLAAVAAQETGGIWGSLRGKLSVDEILEVCVGDTIDFNPATGKGRRAFPRTKDDLVAAPRGKEMFDIARAALLKMAQHVPGFAGPAGKPNKFCHGYGLFQYDLQFFKTDPDYFLERRWRTFSATLGKCIEELEAAMKRAGLGGRPTLSELEQVHVAIAYNAGSFKPARGLQQGFQNSDGKFYGELVFDFLRLAKTVPTPTAPAALAPPPPNMAAVSAPTPVGSTGRVFEVDVKENPLRLRREPKIDPNNKNANVIANLPDGHRVRLISGNPGDKFVEVETSLNGAHLRGFAASEFLVAVATPAPIDVVQPAPAPPTTGVIAVSMPSKAGVITTRRSPPTARSLNEPGQPSRTGTTPQELRASLARIIEHLAVDKASHTRYQPVPNGPTFCNLYAHDYCALAGVYLPRVWWTPDAIEKLAQGIAVEPKLGNTIDEQRANDLFRWLRGFGPRFGWRQTGTLTKLQTEVDAGAVGLVIAQRKEDHKPGHVAMVVPEAADNRARRNAAGEVVSPLQSQAGRNNFRYGAPASWWLSAQYSDSAFWIHA